MTETVLVLLMVVIALGIAGVARSTGGLRRPPRNPISTGLVVLALAAAIALAGFFTATVLAR